MQRFLFTVFISSLILLGSRPAWSAPKSHTLEDLKKLEIVCLVPSYLPKGFHLEKVDMDRNDREGLDEKTPGHPSYSLTYGDGKNREFTIECARDGIGDRNIGDGDNLEEGQFDAGRFGPVYTIFEPKGKTGPKKSIVANWVKDANWIAEEAKNPHTSHKLGRAHGLSGFGISLQEFEKIVKSLHPIREEQKP